MRFKEGDLITMKPRRRNNGARIYLVYEISTISAETYVDPHNIQNKGCEQFQTVDTYKLINIKNLKTIEIVTTLGHRYEKVKR